MPQLEHTVFDLESEVGRWIQVFETPRYQGVVLLLLCFKSLMKNISYFFWNGTLSGEQHKIPLFLLLGVLPHDYYEV